MSLFLAPTLRPHFVAELDLAAQAECAGDLPAAWRHLERAHILGQRSAIAHTQAHLRMAAYALRRADAREVLGQLPRIVGGFFLSLSGRVPTGNTGGANVPAEQPMPIPDDLRRLLATTEPTNPAS